MILWKAFLLILTFKIYINSLFLNWVLIWNLKSRGFELKLYKNNSLICDICEVYRENAQDINIREKDNYIYIDFNLIDGMSSVEEYMIYRVKKDGTELERLNKNI